MNPGASPRGISAIRTTIVVLNEPVYILKPSFLDFLHISGSLRYCHIDQRYWHKNHLSKNSHPKVSLLFQDAYETILVQLDFSKDELFLLQKDLEHFEVKNEHDQIHIQSQ